jgi:hypothetical protein
MNRLREMLAAWLGTNETSRLDDLLEEVLAAHSELPLARARIAGLEIEGDIRILNWLIARAEAEKLCTPGFGETLRSLFSSGDATLKGCATMLDSMPRLPELPAEPTWQGRTFRQLLPLEREDLRAEQPELFKLMRAHNKRGN